jgi:CheY-like chemotaxis protein
MTNKILRTRILVVDDDEINCLLMNAILKKYACDVTILHDGLDALKHLEMNETDIVFMDISMPVMDGYVATKEIKKRFPRVPVIGQSALVMKEDINKGFNAGMDEFITKPINISSVLTLLDRFSLKY